MGGSISCPSEFITAPNGNGCMLQCPTAKNYEMKSSGGVLTCTHKADPAATVPLVIVPAYWAPKEGNPAPNISYTLLPNKEVYANEIKRFNDAMAVADANIDKNVKLNSAFQKLQAAENARDTAPDAYQTARVAYYTLLKGDTWINEEKNRVANAEAQPVINDLVGKYNMIKYRRSQQQAVIDSMNNVKESVISVKDDLGFSVSNFKRQIEDIKNQINKDKREQSVELIKATTWIEVLLNWLIGLASLIAIFFLVRYLTRSKPGQAPSDSDIMSYLRRSAFGSQPTSPIR
jgi:hypothetical protein